MNMSNGILTVDIPEMKAGTGYMITLTGTAVGGQQAIDRGEKFFLKADLTGEYNCIKVEKQWKNYSGNHPEAKLQLYADGEPYGDVVSLPSNAQEMQSYIWTNLPFANNDGKDIVYTVKEINVPENYQVAYSDDGKTITNTYQEVENILPNEPGTVKNVTPDTGDKTKPLIIFGIGLFALMILIATKKTYTNR